ncbi:MAG TPA: type II secretion system protein GspG [Myxococcaceae bacterium]|nr:type II secretion system protein GspG [Myxococcaceae bacterium]
MSDTSTSAAPRPPVRPARLLLAAALLICGAVFTATMALRGKSDPNWAQVHADFEVLEAALTKYREAKGVLPDEGSLDFLVPEFLPAVPVDPWGRPYLFTSGEARVLLTSHGSDGVRGGFGPEQDHTNLDGHVR